LPEPWDELPLWIRLCTIAGLLGLLACAIVYALDN
jgi:hypothetical protein